MLDLEKQHLLVISPHPDDEVLGCGGLIKKIKNAGGKVFVQFLTVGYTKDFSKKGASNVLERLEEVKQVAKFLRFDKYHIGFTGSKHHLKLDAFGQKAVIEMVERKSPLSIEKIKPTIVAFPSLYSYNQDHQLAARAVHAALRPAETSGKYLVPIVLAYEVPADRWSISNQTVPNYFVKLTRVEMTAKLQALKLYASQLRPPPNPRSLKTVEALARLRGSLCGATFAEGFICYRNVI